MEADPDFEIITRPMWSLFSFRYAPAGAEDRDALSLRLIEAVNADGRVYLTQTNFEGQFVIRFQAGSFETTREDVMMTLDVVREVAGRL